MLYLLLSHFLHANMFLIGKELVQYASPLFITAFRMMLGCLMTFTIFQFFSKKNESIFALTRIDLMFIFFLGFFHSFLKSALSFWAMQYMTAGKSSFIFNLSPFVSAYLSYWVFNEIMTAKKWIGICIGFVGVSIMLVNNNVDTYAGAGYGFISIPELALIGAVFANCFGMMISRYLARDRKINIFLSNSLSLSVSSILSFMLMGYFDAWTTLSQENLYYFSSLLLCMVVLNVIVVNMKSWLLKRFSVTIMAFTSFMTPLATTLLEYFLFGEPITKTFVISLTVVFIGLSIFYQEELRQGYVVK